MEEARKKLRMGLVILVILAALVGCIYYFESVRERSTMEDGTLVRMFHEHEEEKNGWN